MYKVLIPQKIDEAGVTYLRERGYEVIEGSGHDKETLIREISDADAVLCRLEEYPPEVIAAGKKVKVLARYGAGFENVDVEYATSLGIHVTNARNCNSRAVAEHTFALLLGCAKHQCYLDAETKKGRWGQLRGSVPSLELHGKTLGILGLGAIGRLVAGIGAQGFGMRVLAYDSYADPATAPEHLALAGSMEEVFREADFLTLHIPSNKETAHTVRRETLALMKPTAVLVNCSRGGVVNEDDLYEALAGGTIAAAGCDVLEREPVARHRLYSLPNFTLSPHIGGLTKEADVKIALCTARAIDDVLRGRRPEYPVNNPANPRQKLD